MDCCGNENKKMKGEYFTVDRKVVLWVVIAVMFLAVVFLTFKAGTLDVNAASSASQAARTAASSSGMVGGC